MLDYNNYVTGFRRVHQRQSLDHISQSFCVNEPMILYSTQNLAQWGRIIYNAISKGRSLTG